MKSESFFVCTGENFISHEHPRWAYPRGAGWQCARNPTVLNCLLLCGREQLLSRLGWGVAALKTLKEIRDRSTLAA